MSVYIMDSLIVYKLQQMCMIVMLLFQYCIYRMGISDERVGADQTDKLSFCQNVFKMPSAAEASEKRLYGRKGSSNVVLD